MHYDTTHHKLSTNQNIIYILKITAPYLAVIIGLYILENAWLSILLYHVQIVFWWLIDRKSAFKQSVALEEQTPNYPDWITTTLATAKKGILPISALAGVACYFLLPIMLRDVGGLELWLNNHQLTGIALLLLIPYFGFIHPAIEQTHWHPLTKSTHPYEYISHLSFAIYHGLVLLPILKPIWVLLCITSLSCISYLWAYTRKQNNTLQNKGRYLAYFSHMFADLGIILAAYFYSV